MYNFQLKQNYSFNVHPVPVLGNSFKNVTVVALMDREQANKEIDTNALHVQIFPYLPTGTPNRADGYDYVKIKFPSGNTTVLGLAWIVEDSVEQVTSTTVSVKINNATPSDVTRIRNALVQNGFNSIEITVG